jgi:TonB family protein
LHKAKYNMKFIFLSGLLNMFTVFVSYSQVIGRFYYNEHWELTHQKSVVFFRVCVFDTVNNQFAGEVKDYTKDGQLLMTGTYNGGARNGAFTGYYPNGLVESRGNFINNQPTGLWTYYYPDGSPKQEATFTGNEFTMHFFYDSTNTKVLENGTGYWYEVYEEYKLPSKIIIRGNFLNGKKNGDWECLLENGDYIYKEKFKSGEFKKGYLTDSRGNRKSDNNTEFLNKLLPHFKHDVMERFEREATVTQQDYPYLKFLRKKLPTPSDTLISGSQIFLIVEESASPISGMSGFYEHIAHQLRYPAEARKMGIEGKVFVEFVVNQDGSISDVRAIKGIGGGCDEEAVRVIAAAPRWNPGYQKGEPVRQRFVMPVIFQLGRTYFRR